MKINVSLSIKSNAKIPWNEGWRRERRGEWPNEPNQPLCEHSECLVNSNKNGVVVVRSAGGFYSFNFQWSKPLFYCVSSRFCWDFVFNSNRWLAVCVLKDNVNAVPFGIMYKKSATQINIVWRHRVMQWCLWFDFVECFVCVCLCYRQTFHAVSLSYLYVCIIIYKISCPRQSQYTHTYVSTQHYDDDVKTNAQREGGGSGINSNDSGENDDIDVIWIIHQQCN